MKIETALLSVSDKSGIEALASGLVQNGIRILSTGGTAQCLREAGIPVDSVSDHTGFPEILDGRVKTLHPRIHGGILARHQDPDHARTLQEHQIEAIGLVVVNLYPFARTIARPDVTRQDAVEQIDIGGPCLLRAAAKNHATVTAVVDPADYPKLLQQLQEGEGRTTPEFRLRSARKAFAHTAAYDAAIAAYLDQETGSPEALPSHLSLQLERLAGLRYGENPHQAAALYAPPRTPRGLAAARQLQGKELSFNNYLDLQAAWGLTREFQDVFCAIIKHNNPCGAALGPTAVEAYQRALRGDPVSAFGSVIALNVPLDADCAREMTRLFVEAVVAPGYDPEALEILAAKKNLRVMQIDPSDSPSQLDFKTVSGGLLVQEADRGCLKASDLKVVTRRAPDDAQTSDLLFAWRICKHVKSNAIVYASGGRSLGIGAGQMSRIDSARLAAEKACDPLQGAVMASDAFFPFRDGIDQAAEVGIQAVIQPGGSVRDTEVIAAADEHGMTMVFTGMRHFRH